MTPFKKLDGNSGSLSYESSEDSIQAVFKPGRFCYDLCNKTQVQHLKTDVDTETKHRLSGLSIFVLVIVITLFSSVCWGLTKTEVSQLYVTIFGRASEGSGNAYWQTDPSSTCMTTAADIMLKTQEAKDYFSSSYDYGNWEFVNHLYNNTFGKTYEDDPDGIEYWRSELDSGKSRGEIVAAIITAAQLPINSDSGQDRFMNRVAVSDYCADTVIEFSDLYRFRRAIDAVTDDADTIDAGKRVLGNMALESSFEITLGSTTTDERVNDVKQTADGGFIIAGAIGPFSTENFGQEKLDGWLVKTDGLGNEIWSKTFGGTSADQIISVEQATDGGYTFFIKTYSVYSCAGLPCTKNHLYSLIKADSKGNETCSTTFNAIPHSYSSGIGYFHQVAEEEYIIAGTGSINASLFLAGINSTGDIIWSKEFTFGNNSVNRLQSIQQTRDGGYIIAGETVFPENNTDIYLIKTDINGNEIWSNTIGRSNCTEQVKSIQETADGGFIIVGEIQEDSCKSDIYLMKADRNGNELWSKAIGGIGWDRGYSIKQTLDGGYLITGHTDSYSNLEGRTDLYLIKMDSLGNEVSAKIFDGVFSISMLLQTADDGYIVTGTKHTLPWSSGESNGYLIKIDSDSALNSEW
ncbi:MAG: DUF4214 domain-containing protein [Desulfobacteraceae bacterium]|nr:DUF4214 domain-containing protein [Desulfobacteraceae bacterium]